MPESLLEVQNRHVRWLSNCLGVGGPGFSAQSHGGNLPSRGDAVKAACLVLVQHLDEGDCFRRFLVAMQTHFPIPNVPSGCGAGPY